MTYDSLKTVAVILAVSLAQVTLTNQISISDCQQLPPQCTAYFFEPIQGLINPTQTKIVCENNRGFDSNTQRKLTNIIKNCSVTGDSGKTLLIMPPKGEYNRIVDESFGPILMTPINLEIWGLSGFDIQTSIDVFTKLLQIETDFNLYKQEQLVKSCGDFSPNSTFIFRPKHTELIEAISIVKPNCKNPICSLFFRDARIESLSINNIVHSFIITRVFSFVDPVHPANDAVNSLVNKLNIYYSYGLVIDSRLLNPNVFGFTTVFGFYLTKINSIEENVFKPLKSVKMLVFTPQSLVGLIRRQGIDWARSINSDVNVDMENAEAIITNYNRSVWINFFEDPHTIHDHRIRFAYDRDLCLYMDFPFQQMIYFQVLSNRGIYFYRKDYKFDCAEMWILRFMLVTKHLNTNISEKMENYHYQNLKSSNFTACNFEKRFGLCRKSDFKSVSHNKSNALDFVFLSELVLIILSTVCSVFGMVTNISVVFVIFHKENVKAMREKHYLYMSLHSLFNCLIFLSQILSLMSECHYIGLFCSSINRFVGVQYVKIILVEYLNVFSRLMANFTYLGFSLCRMSRVGKDHRKFIVYFNEKLKIKKFIGLCLFVSAGLSVSKAMQYQINFFLPNLSHPNLLIQDDSSKRWYYRPKYVAIAIFNGIYDFLNYFLFVFIHFIVDLILLKKLRRAIKEKEEKMRQMKRAIELEKSLKETEDSRRRAINMVILNSVFNLVTKVPSMVTSLNDLRLLTLEKPNKKLNPKKLFIFNDLDTSFTLRVYCSLERGCLLFQSFCNLLFLFSSSLVLFFLKSFDMNFKDAFRLSFKKFHYLHKLKQQTL